MYSLRHSPYHLLEKEVETPDANKAIQFHNHTYQTISWKHHAITQLITVVIGVPEALRGSQKYF